VKTLGLPYAYDLTCGNPSGAGPVANTRSGSSRINAYTGYISGKSRPNLTGLSYDVHSRNDADNSYLHPLVLTGANVGKVLLSSGPSPRATGVEFQDASSHTYTVNAGREVLVATGSVKTPGEKRIRSELSVSC
jgi:hypothetical protein